MTSHNKLNYVEFPASDIEATKHFFMTAFGWQFIDYGEAYTSFSNQGLDGGFYQSNLCASTQTGSALLVLYSADLTKTLQNVKECGGEVIKDIFEFPGGCRFHFKEPSGNEFAVWSEQS